MLCTAKHSRIGEYGLLPAQDRNWAATYALTGTGFLAARFSPHIGLSCYTGSFAVFWPELLGAIAPEAAVAIPRAIWIVSRGVPPILRKAVPFASQGCIPAPRFASPLKVLEITFAPVSRRRQSGPASPGASPRF